MTFEIIDNYFKSHTDLAISLFILIPFWIFSLTSLFNPKVINNILKNYAKFDKDWHGGNIDEDFGKLPFKDNYLWILRILPISISLLLTIISIYNFA